MKTKAEQTSLEFKRNGITIRIRPTMKNGFERFVLDYRVKGERKLVWRSTLADARAAASDAIDKITAGQSEVLELTNSDAHAYLRARDALANITAPLDQIAREYVEAAQLLSGRASLIEACRDWQRRHDVRLPSKTLSEAAADCIEQQRKDGKTPRRIEQLVTMFGRFTADHNMQVAEMTPAIMGAWLANLGRAERTRRNYRDTIAFLCRFCVQRGYLAKGTDWFENVQNYSARKLAEIEIYTVEEVARLLAQAGADMLPFIAIAAFAGLRHAEIDRLDWSEVDLDDGFIEVRAAKSKTGERRLVPIQPNLKHWLLPHRQARGTVCPYANSTKQLLKTGAAAGVEWKHNGLRHSCISYRVAQCADQPRVADESGNSVAVIRGHYLRRVKPAEAARYFALAPNTAADQAKILDVNIKAAA